MASHFDFLHIKRRTAGSSNELSFDVLDAARHDLDVADEVKRRKKARRARTIRTRLIAGVAVIALLCVGVLAAQRYYTEKVDFSGRLNGLITQFVQIDNDLVSVDLLMNDPLSEFKADERTRARAAVPTMKSELQDMAARAQEMQADAPGDFEVVTLSEVAAAAQARVALLKAADDALTLADEVNARIAEANRAWSQVLDADQTARQASSLANAATTEEETLQAQELTQQALGQFGDARTALQDMQAKVSGLSFEQQIAYIDLRIQALDYAIQTADALLANDREGATQANDAYNSTERQAADMAAELPASPGEPVKQLYAANMQKLTSAYDDARAHVTSVDSSLRSRLS